MNVPNVPKEYDLDYLVFQLAGGDVTKDAEVWDNTTYEDCIRYVCFKQYEAYVNEKLMSNGR